MQQQLLGRGGSRRKWPCVAAGTPRKSDLARQGPAAAVGTEAGEASQVVTYSKGPYQCPREREELRAGKRRVGLKKGRC